MRSVTPEARFYERELARSTRETGEALQSRSLWRARARLAEFELEAALTDCEQLRNLIRDAEAKIHLLESGDAVEVHELKAELDRERKASKDLETKVAELSAQLVENKPSPPAIDDQGARFELHRMLVGGSGKAASWWASEVKRVRGLLGGEP